MKRIARMMFFLLLALGMAGAFLSRARAQEPEASLHILSLKIHIDEAADRVESSLILENKGDAPWEGTLELPLISGGVKPGSLQWESLLPARLTGEASLSCRIPAGRAQLFHYVYQSAAPLIHARVIALDILEVVQSSPDIGQSLDKLEISLALREEDLPLVREISPINWDFSDNAISWTFYGLQPGELLSRIYVEKESYRNLKGSREFEPNEVQQAVLRHAEDWFREGLGLSGVQGNLYAIFQLMLGEDGNPDLEGWEMRTEYDDPLSKNNKAFRDIVNYLILRELLSGRIQEEEEDSILFNICYYNSSPITAEMLRRLYFGDELYRMVVVYDMEDSLEGVPLYVYEGLEDMFSVEWILTQKTPQALLTTRPSFHVLSTKEALLFRISRLSFAREIRSEALQAYLSAIRGDLLLSQQILDNRETPLPKNKRSMNGSEWESDHEAFFALIPDNPLSEACWKGALAQFLEENPYREGEVYCSLREGEDALLSRQAVPTLIHYCGTVEWLEYEGEIYPWFFHFSEFSYASYHYGLFQYRRMMQHEALAGWRAARGALEQEAALQMAQEIAGIFLAYIYQSFLRRIIP